ncbi:HAS-barrel domain-containing protein [Roseiflexus sp.]|uniref:HAS-barrel domain-containing protein n=1 Tax=Roseiflexus sp. TaxID=2562120 RepID=UPI00398B8BD5
MPEMPVRIAEVIEATSTEFTAAAYELLQAPPLGALVRAQARDERGGVYGLVYDIRTGSRDAGGRAVVRGRTYAGREVYDADIYHEHPDLAEVLQTEFSAVIVGFVDDGRICQFLPPQPPPVHYSVYECDIEEVQRFNQATDYFRTVLFMPHIPGDETLAAALRLAARAASDERAFLVRAGREIAALLHDDYDRLMAILRRIRP